MIKWVLRPCRHASMILISLLSLTSSLAEDTKPLAAPQPGSAPTFSSAQGGFKVDVPTGWHVNEFPGPNAYHCTISPDPVVTAQDRINLGVRIQRTTDSSQAFGWEPSEPKVQALSYLIHAATEDLVSKGKSCVVSFTQPMPTPDQIAQSIAAARAKTPDGGKGLPAVVLIPSDSPKTLSSMESFEYDVLIDYEGVGCSYHHFLMGVKKRKWLALHFVTSDCKTRDTNQSVFQRVVASLDVNSKWPK